MIKAYWNEWGLSIFSHNCYWWLNPFLLNTHTTLFRSSSSFVRYSELQMVYSRGHRIFGKDAGFAAFHGKSLITFKETRIENHRYFWHRTLLHLADLVASMKTLQIYALGTPSLKVEYIILLSSLRSEINMPCSFNPLVFILLTIKLEAYFICIYIHLKVNSKFSTWKFLLLFWWEGLCDFPLLMICFQDQQSDLYFPTSFSKLFCVISSNTLLKSGIL